MKRSLILSLAIFALTASSVSAKITNDNLSRNPIQQTGEIESAIDAVFHDYSKEDRETIKRIADCESGGKSRNGGPNGLITHLDKAGRLVKNKSSGAAGAMQIYSATHNAAIKARFNEAEIWDNLLYARELIEGRKRAGQSKFADWAASKNCWTKKRPDVYASS